MNRLKSEQGYALISVLLIIIVFSVIFLSFMGQAFSSTKQNQVTEKNTRTVAAAEMGVSYYQVAIQEMFESKRSVVNTHVSSIMSQPNAASTKDFKREATLKMATELQKMIPIGTIPSSIPIDGHPNASFFIKDFTVTPDSVPTSYKINISFNVVGTEEGKETTLNAKMLIDLDTIINLPSTDDPNNYIIPTYNNIFKPSTLCGDINCNPIYVEGNKSYPGNNVLKNNQTIYTTGSLTLTDIGNENNISNLKIHADGDITIGQNMNSQTNALIETNGNATFMQNLKIDTTSKLLVRQTLTVSQQLAVSNDSFVYVGGNAKVNFLDISSASKMCVYGDLLYDSSITVTTKNKENPSTLYVQGKVKKLTNGVYQTVENTGYNIDQNNFKIKCGTYVPPEFQINWGDDIQTVISDVEY